MSEEGKEGVYFDLSTTKLGQFELWLEWSHNLLRWSSAHRRLA